MRLRIEIKMVTAAFDKFRGAELARILDNLARSSFGGAEDFRVGDFWPLFDVNGNNVGQAWISHR